MRRDDQRQAVKNIPLEQLKPFKNHPFQVRDDEEFRRLVESIEIHGVIHPAVARQIGEECYSFLYPSLPKPTQAYQCLPTQFSIIVTEKQTSAVILRR